MLHIFVEGQDDERFFQAVFGKYLGNYKFIQYASMSAAQVNKFIQSINRMPNSDYIFFKDSDGKSIEEKKRQTINKYCRLEISKVFVVQYEIESWYYAGASPKVCEKLKIKHYVQRTDGITKEQFNTKLSKTKDRKIIMMSMLETYELELAIARNTSLSIFYHYIKKELT